MSYRVVFEFSPLYELVTSLDLFLNKKSVKNVDIGTEWIKAVQKKVDAHQFDFGTTKDLPCFRYLYLLIWQSPEKEDVEVFLNWLGSLQPGSLYEKLFSYVSEPLPPDLTKIRDQFVELIRAWNDIYFSTFDAEIVNVLRESVIISEKRALEFSSESLVEKISGGIRLEAYEGLQQVIMIPTFHMSPLVTTSKFKNIVQILYPVDMPVPDPNQPSKKLMRLSKALADENRLKIIRLLTASPLTFTEILKHFDISKSTVHHHIMLLRTAGLISAYHDNECCSETFVYRPMGLLELNESFSDFIKQ